MSDEKAIVYLNVPETRGSPSADSLLGNLRTWLSQTLDMAWNARYWNLAADQGIQNQHPGSHLGSNRRERVST